MLRPQLTLVLLRAKTPHGKQGAVASARSRRYGHALRCAGSCVWCSRLLCHAQEGPQDEPTRAQARLVKNRMSAARSRERKLAYTAELEVIVGTLRAENDALRAALTRARVPLPDGVQ